MHLCYVPNQKYILAASIKCYLRTSKPAYSLKQNHKPLLISEKQMCCKYKNSKKWGFYLNKGTTYCKDLLYWAPGG